MIIFGHINNDKDVYNYQGAEFDAIGIDELQHFKEWVFDFLMTRLRTSKPGWKPCFFGTGNPGGIGHGWIKRRWVEREFRPNYFIYNINLMNCMNLMNLMNLMNCMNNNTSICLK